MHGPKSYSPIYWDDWIRDRHKAKYCGFTTRVIKFAYIWLHPISLEDTCFIRKKHFLWISPLFKWASAPTLSKFISRFGGCPQTARLAVWSPTLDVCQCNLGQDTGPSGCTTGVWLCVLVYAKGGKWSRVKCFECLCVGGKVLYKYRPFATSYSFQCTETIM